MTTLRKHVPNLLLLVIGFALIYGTFLIANAVADSPGSGSAVATLDAAHADAKAAFDAAPVPGAPVDELPTLPNPLEEPGEFGEGVVSRWQEGSFLAAALLVIWGLVHVLSKYVKWLQFGWRTAAVTIALTVLSTAITSLASGVTPTISWAFGLITSSIPMLINGKGTPIPAKTS